MTKAAPNQALFYGQSLSRCAWGIVRKCRDSNLSGPFDRYLARWLGCLGNCPHVFWGTGSAHAPEDGRIYSPVPVEICSICMDATPASVFELGFASFMESDDHQFTGYSEFETRIVVELGNYMRTLNAINEPWARDCIFLSRPYVSRVLGVISQTDCEYVALEPEENADEGASHLGPPDPENYPLVESEPESPTDIVEAAQLQMIVPHHNHAVGQLGQPAEEPVTDIPPAE